MQSDFLGMVKGSRRYFCLKVSLGHRLGTRQGVLGESTHLLLAEILESRETEDERAYTACPRR